MYIRAMLVSVGGRWLWGWYKEGLDFNSMVVSTHWVSFKGDIGHIRALFGSILKGFGVDIRQA